jgi:putative methyltransferase (TIGR04325 family)
MMKIKQWIPPIFFELLKLLFSRKMWTGDYKTWELVARECSGYSSQVILQKHVSATEAVLAGRARYERDTVLFQDELINFPVIASLLMAVRDGNLSVIDFGGALGSTFYQNKKALEHLTVKWSVVEQPNFVQMGKERFQTQQVTFYEDLESALSSNIPHVFFSSCTFQYLKEPEEFIQKMVGMEIPYIILDRISFNSNSKPRLTKQTVPEAIYPVEMPCWFFSEPRFLDLFSERYELIWQFPSLDNADIPSAFKGFFFKRKDLR